MPFSELQAPFFFGRDAEREIVTANLLASRLTLLYGPSGVGKSSLLNAGVAAQLRQQARQNLEEHGTSEFAVIVFRSWRDDPLSALGNVLSRRIGEEIPGSLAKKLEVVSSRLDRDLLIILDQFEEYFLYHAHESGNGAFAREFGQAVKQDALRVSFLISMREDSLAKLDRFESCIPSIFENRLRIDHLDFEAAREAISKPVDTFNGMMASQRRPMTIEGALIERVLDQARTSRIVHRGRDRSIVEPAIALDAAEERVETPYLQLVMTRLWEEEQRAGSRALRTGTLERLGGAEKIVSSHLDAAVGSLTPVETDTAARVFNHLVTPSRTKIAHSVPDLADYVGVAPDALVPLLQKLSSGQNRILTPVAPAPDQPAHLRYQILHDILAAPILEWRTRYMQRRERADAEAQADVQRQRAEQEARARARLRKVSILLMAMVIVSTGLAWVANLQTRKVEERRAEAESARLDADVAKHTAEARRLELEAAIRARSAAERIAELNRLQAQAARAELQGALQRASELRQRAAQTQQEVVTEQAASAKLNREAQAERKSAATTHRDVDRPRRPGDQAIDTAGIMKAIQRYQAAYRSFDVDALAAVYPRLPGDRRKHLKQSKEACRSYEVILSELHTRPGVGDSVIVEAQSSYQCVSKAGNAPKTFPMREDFTLRKDLTGAWIIDSMTAPPQGRGDPFGVSRPEARK
jgi:hypothetical protein